MEFGGTGPNYILRIKRNESEIQLQISNPIKASSYPKLSVSGNLAYP